MQNRLEALLNTAWAGEVGELDHVWFAHNYAARPATITNIVWFHVTCIFATVIEPTGGANTTVCFSYIVVINH